MSLFEKVKEMLGFQPKTKANYIGPDVSRAVQRNEQAAAAARQALEDLKYSDTLRQIAGKMK